MGIHVAFSAKESARPATVCNIAEQVIFSRRKEPSSALLLGLLTNEVRELGLDHLARPQGVKRSPKEQLKYIDRLQFIAMSAIRLIEEDR